MRFGPILGGLRRRAERTRSDRIRIAIVATPRSGNTWLRRMLDHVYRFSEGGPECEMALYNPLEAPWSNMPEHCILMAHWHRVAPFRDLLKKHDFRVITLARHPLDVMISILQYSGCGYSLRWLEGEAGDEQPIFSATPTSPEFLQYALGPRARALMSVSPEWWRASGTQRVRYEKLVADPLGELGRLVKSLGVEPRGRLEEAVEACKIDRLRNNETARHFWKGQIGLWKSLMTARVARRIALEHRSAFSLFGYPCDPDETLSKEQAEENWRLLNAPPGAAEGLRRSA